MVRLWRLGGRLTNFFLMFQVSSHIPNLSPEFLWFCDDFILLQDLSPEDARRSRYVEDLSQVTHRGRGKWKDSLWRTFDFLERHGYTGYNFEAHLPTYFTRTWITRAWCEFRDFVTEDRWYGLPGPTAILNHAHRSRPLDLVSRDEESRWVGFHHAVPMIVQVREKSLAGRHS